MVLPSHIPPLAWGQACAFWAVGVFFIGAEDGGERIPFFKGAVCALIKREGGTAKVPPSHIPLLAVIPGGGCVALGWERLAGPERNGFLFTKFTIFICKMSEDFTCGIY